MSAFKGYNALDVHASANGLVLLRTDDNRSPLKVVAQDSQVIDLPWMALSEADAVLGAMTGSVCKVDAAGSVVETWDAHTGDTVSVTDVGLRKKMTGAVEAGGDRGNVIVAGRDGALVRCDQRMQKPVTVRRASSTADVVSVASAPASQVVAMLDAARCGVVIFGEEGGARRERFVPLYMTSNEMRSAPGLAMHHSGQWLTVCTPGAIRVVDVAKGAEDGTSYIPLMCKNRRVGMKVAKAPLFDSGRTGRTGVCAMYEDGESSTYYLGDATAGVLGVIPERKEDRIDRKLKAVAADLSDPTRVVAVLEDEEGADVVRAIAFDDELSDDYDTDADLLAFGSLSIR